MLFNSVEFLLFYLPVVVGVFFVLGRRSERQRLAGIWLTASSLFFYGWWNPSYVPLLLVSMIFNFVMARRLVLMPNRILLGCGIAANLILLGYYKYSGFLVQTVDQVAGLDWAIPNVVLPLAISFFTFQQIAYLIDAHDGAVVQHDFLSYCLFITFFPHLIAGPITHHREMFPQFNDPDTFRPRLDNLAVGLTLFLVGLFKKVAIADTMGTYATPVYAAAADAIPLTFLEAWGGAISYALQVYFDFSGYTDMAIGLGIMFGISLPPNFNSPFKARNIIEFWSRWHMTLTRFVTSYVYNPIVVHMTRRQAERDRPLPRRGAMPPGVFLNVVAFPTILSMLVIGVWHGAGWQFVIFGLLHGVLLTVNHAWRRIKVQLGMPRDSNHPLAVGASVLLTFTCVVMALAFFRAENVAAAWNLLFGMLGGNGVVLPSRFTTLPGMAHLLDLLDVPAADLRNFGFVQILWILGLLASVWLLPNSQQLMRDHRTALAAKPPLSWLQVAYPVLIWRPARYVALAVGCLGVLVVVRAISGAPTEFLYFQF